MRKLMTQEIKKRIPNIGSTDNEPDPVAYLKLFAPWSNWTWYACEYDPKTEECFGLVYGHAAELGHFSLAEMAAVRSPVGLAIERDTSFKPTPLSQCDDPTHYHVNPCKRPDPIDALPTIEEVCTGMVLAAHSKFDDDGRLDVVETTKNIGRQVKVSGEVCMEEMEELEMGMSNYDHTIDQGFAEALQCRPGKVFGCYAGWNFNGIVWFLDGSFWVEVWVYKSPQEIIEAESLDELMQIVCDKYGRD